MATRAEQAAWLPELYRKATILQRAAIYMATHPITYFTPAQLSRAVSNSWSLLVSADYCMRLVTVGLARMRIGYVKPGKNRYFDTPVLVSNRVPEHLDDLPANKPVIVYAASRTLVDLVESGDFLKMIERERRKPTSVNGRIIRELVGLHPEDITVKALHSGIEASESLPSLARRLEHLATIDWVVFTEKKIPEWTRPGYGDQYYRAHGWKVKLSTGGWLRVQRAKHDGTELIVPKPQKKKKKKEKKLVKAF